ncbi:MAG TPA: TA system VapC family ribonuclease toxin [Bryobacteraceae bacterium]|nr:TA system VapC family ribonuclease toxin [Bryobacteraceae bacterium]
MLPEAVSAPVPRTALLDVNVLVAMCWPTHEFHQLVSRRLAAIRAQGWATCPMTEAGFVRVSAQPSAKLGASLQDAFRVLDENRSEADHVFWPQDVSVADLTSEIRRRLIGHKQLTDALLLDLAIRKGGLFVTLDRLVRHLLPADSPHQNAIEVIPTA